MTNSCKKSPEQKILRFSLVERNTSFQNLLESKFHSAIDSTLKIYIIDGNNDGKYHYKKDVEKDKDFPDMISVKDKIFHQFSGAELSDSVYIKYFQKYYLITVSIKDLTGIMEELDSFNSNVDIALFNKLPDISVYSISERKYFSLIDVFEKESHLYLAKNWAPFCAPCIKELTQIEEKISFYRSQNIEIMYLVDSSYIDIIDHYFSSDLLKEILYLCNYDEVGQKLNYQGFPSSILFSGGGQYIRHYAIPLDSIYKNIVSFR